VGAFLAALHAEIDLRADVVDARFGPPGAGRAPLDSVYLGGGTPSLLPADAVAALLDHVGRRFGIADGAEITIEANPGPAERGDAAALARAGVTRLSLGAQRLADAELRRLGRRHRPEDVGDAVAAAREAGIGSVSLDLLYDVPGDSAAAWAATLSAALALEPDHLSLYALTLDDPDAEGLTSASGDHLPVTTGARRWRDRARAGQDDDRAAEAYGEATERLTAAGYRGYEISNWARPGHESRHNLAYWQRRPVEALGPGAHAFDGAERRWNAARLDGYLAALVPPGGGTPRLPPGGAETPDPAVARAEAVVLALRTDRGVAAAMGDRPPLSGVRDWALEAGLLEATPDARLVLTTRGRLLSNEVFARLV
jgi:oxygen-independent coproporphyrinogen-3 oxidase